MQSSYKLPSPEEGKKHTGPFNGLMFKQTIQQADRIDNIVREVMVDYMQTKGYPVIGISREAMDFNEYCWVQWDGETIQPGGLVVTLINNPSKTPNLMIAVGEHPATGQLLNIKLKEVIALLERETGIKGRHGRIHK